MSKILLLDGNSLLNRAFYGIRPLSARDGTPTNAIYGFLNILSRLLSEENPDGLAVCFDLKGPTFRHEAFEDYKAHRKPMPEELALQLPLIKDILDAMNITRYELAGYEADDLLGTLCKSIASEGDECVLVTGDRDSLQLVGDGVVLKYISTRGGQPVQDHFDEMQILIDYGITPRQFIDVKALMGDASDNIPGVKGIGEKTALALIQKFGSLDKVYENIDSKDIRPAVREKLLAEKDLAYLSYTLAEIDTNAPIECGDECHILKPADNDRLYLLLDRLEMKSLIARYKLVPPGGGEDISPPQSAPPPKRRMIFSEGEGLDFIKSIERAGIWADFDLESFSLACGEVIAVLDCRQMEKGAFHRLLSALFERGVGLVCHDAKRFYRYSLETDIPLPTVVFDTMLGASLLDMPHELQGLCRHLLGEIIETGESQGGQAELEPTPDANDESAMVLKLCALLEEALENADCTALYREVELPLIEVIAKMEHEGFLVDADALKAFGNVLDLQIEDISRDIYKAAGEEFNINSSKQLGVILFEKLGLPSGKKTKTGFSTSYDVLKSLAPFHKIVVDVLEYRTLTKLKSTYVDGLLKVISDDGRIHSTFNQAGTVTGRLSSTEPNMQNIPVRSEPGSTLREMFHAARGCVLIDADYSQIELRVLAHIADDKIMQDAFARGEDIHRVTAAQVFDIPLESVTDEQRSFSKAVNFGIVYGISDFSLADDIGSTRAEAKWMIDRYLDKYYGVREYMKQVVEKAKASGFVSTLYGRRRYLPDIKAANFNARSAAERVALNMPIQGTAADIIKRAMVNVSRKLDAEGLRAKLILQVHDELIVEAATEDAQRVREILSREMEDAAKLKVALRADAGIGKTWAEAKS